MSSTSLTVMTFNLRYASDEPPDSWPDRRPVVAECLRRVAPDVIGTQEGWARQIQDITTDRPAYAPVGRGRDADGTGETGTVLYVRDRLAVRAHGDFWLSDTPELPGSTSWGNTLPRMVTWVRFADLRLGHELLVVNTHLDHESSLARVRGAELICSRVPLIAAGDDGQAVPVIITGDFNAVSGADPTYDVFLRAGYVDLRFAASERRGPELDSFHGYRTPGTAGAHIDWILARGAVTPLQFALVDVQSGGQYPSDHFPLMSTVQLY